MISMKARYTGKVLRWVLLITAIAAFSYGVGRLYYRLTDGFLVSNITSSNTYDARWETRPLTLEESELVQHILHQEFRYLGKGCQSYVFASQDGNYVLKFFKYQRLRPKYWLNLLSFIPWIQDYRQRKILSKDRKRAVFFQSWKVAFDLIPETTGVVFVHLNPSENLNTELKIYDKMGFEHVLNMNHLEFMIQKRATMLRDVINDHMKKGQLAQAESLLETFIQRILANYQKGIADNDHALMQNSGVYEGMPIHIDVGQFVFDESVKDPKFYTQELFTKTYKFRLWLKKNHPELAEHFDLYLKRVMGDKFLEMKPVWREKIEIF